MANPFLNKTFLGAAARFMPGQHTPFGEPSGAPKPYEKKRKPVRLGPPREEQIPGKKRKKRKDVPTS